MKRAEVIASLVLDLIIQGYPNGSDFLDYADVSDVVMIFWYQVLNNRFKEREKIAYRSGNDIEGFPDNWYETKTIKIDGDKFKLPSFISFEGDDKMIGIRTITTTEDSECDCNLVLIPYNKRKAVRFTPGSDTNLYLYMKDGSLMTANETGCKVDEISIRYIPGGEDECGDDIESEKAKIPEALAAETMILTYNFLINAKNQTPIIDKTNNNNPNKTQASEVDPSALVQNK